MLRAIVAALFVNSPDGGCVESVFTFATHLFPLFVGISLLYLRAPQFVIFSCAVPTVEKMTRTMRRWPVRARSIPDTSPSTSTLTIQRSRDRWFRSMLPPHLH